MVLLVIVAVESIMEAKVKNMDKEGMDVVIFVVKAADVDKIVDVVEAMDVKRSWMCWTWRADWSC